VIVAGKTLQAENGVSILFQARDEEKGKLKTEDDVTKTGTENQRVRLTA